MLWCRSHLVRLVFERSIPTCARFPLENFFGLVYIGLAMTRRLARAKFHDITSAQEVGLHALVCGRRGCQQKLAIQQKRYAGNSTKTGNSTKQQKLAIQRRWKFNKMGNSTKSGSSAKLEIQDCFSVSIWQFPPTHSTNLEWPFLYTHSIMFFHIQSLCLQFVLNSVESIPMFGL